MKTIFEKIYPQIKDIGKIFLHGNRKNLNLFVIVFVFLSFWDSRRTFAASTTFFHPSLIWIIVDSVRPTPLMATSRSFPIDLCFQRFLLNHVSNQVQVNLSENSSFKTSVNFHHISFSGRPRVDIQFSGSYRVPCNQANCATVTGKRTEISAFSFSQSCSLTLKIIRRKKKTLAQNLKKLFFFFCLELLLLSSITNSVLYGRFFFSNLTEDHLSFPS